MRTRKKSYRVFKKDSIEEAIQKNDVLIKSFHKLEKEIKRLKSENGTLMDAWEITEEYLCAVSEGKTREEIFNEIATKTNLNKIKKKCPAPKCGENIMNKKQFDGFYIISCSRCGYRNKVNEKRSSKIEKN